MSQHNDYHQLREHWYQKLKESGFVDIEDTKGNLKDTWTRGLGFKNQRKICQFFLKLDQFINENQIPEIYKKIIDLYSKGICSDKGVKKHLNLKNGYQIKKILNRYKTYQIPEQEKQILSLYSEGVTIVEIQKRLKLEKRYQVKKVLKQYKTIILQTIEDEYVLET